MLKLALTYVVEHREIELGLIGKSNLYWLLRALPEGSNPHFSPSYELSQRLETWLQGGAFSW